MGRNSIDGKTDIRISSTDFRKNRVKEIRAPVGHDSTPIVTHRFIYLSDAKGSLNKTESFAGKTKVYDAYLNETVYCYNKEHRPTSITRHLNNGQKYSIEQFIWDEGGRKEGGKKLSHFLKNDPKTSKAMLNDHGTKNACMIGNLIGKFLKDSNGKIEHALYFNYDSRGNIKKEIFFGNLSGNNQISIELDNDQIPIKNGCENYCKHFTYSKNGYNHLLSEKEDNGREIEYAYDNNTQQISAKYIKDGDKIQLRQFFFYDPQTAALVKVIKDDGSHHDVNLFADVTERTITEITPNDQFPIGLPKIIEEKYWEAGKEIFLKRMKCHYDSYGNLCHQDHFDGHGNFCYALFWTYDSFGNVIEKTNALGHKIIRHYDKNNLLKIEIGPRPQDKVEYDYDYSNRLIQTKRHLDGICLVTQHRYDFCNNRIATIDHFGQTTSYKYDEFNRLIKTTHPSILLTEDCLFTPTEEVLEYNINDQPTKIKDVHGYITSLNYNARGKPICHINSDGTTERFEYDLDGTLAKSIAPNGTCTSYTRDFLGRVIREETFDANHQLLSIQSFNYKGTKLISQLDAENCLTTYSYDGAGRLIGESCGNASKKFTYDSLGRVDQIIQGYGNQLYEISIQTFSYDFLNQIIEEKLQDAQGNILQRISYTYDELGNKISTKREMESGNSLTQVQYHADGKPIKIIDTKGLTTHFIYDYAHRNGLDQFVLKVTKTDPLGRNTVSIFDTLGRIREVIQYNPFGALIAKQEIFYDPLGKRIKTKDVIISDGKIKGELINAWSYHPCGQENVIHEAVGSPQQKLTYIFYNAYSQKEKVVKPNGTELYYTYDALGRLKTLKSSDGTIDYDYTYNLRHQVQQVIDHRNQHITTRVYDNEGKLKEEILGNTLSLSYDYDRLGRMTKLTLPDHSSTVYLYNAAYLKKIQRYKHDQLVYEHNQIKHDLSGNLIQSRLIGNAGQIHTSYDSLGRIKAIQSASWQMQIPEKGYDSVGRLEKKSIQDGAGIKEEIFTYNDMDHLQTESGHVSYVYKTDSLHNRLKKNRHSYEINALNQIISDGNFKYKYDYNGNLIEKIKGDQKTVYTYDALDRLIGTSSSEGLTTYGYDPFHRRLTKTHQQITYRYLYQGENEIGSVDAQGEIAELRILGIGIDAEIGAAVALELYGKTYAPIHDEQGNCSSLIDPATGQSLETYRYSAFGEETIFNQNGEAIASTQVGNPWRFASKRVDSETSWIYFGRRYYDPVNGKWTTPDPLGFADGTNLYAYLHHNPLNAFDAYGLSGKAYRDSCKVARNSPNYSVFSDLGRHEIQQNDHTRASYISNGIGHIHHASAGVLHGIANFFTHQIADIASLACRIGVNESDDYYERFHFQMTYAQCQESHLNAIDNWISGCLCVDPNNSIYQNCCSYTTAGMEIGTLLIGGYGAIKGGIAKAARISTLGTKLAGKAAAQELRCMANVGGNVSRGAESVNAGINLNNKLSLLQSFPQSAAKIRILPDNRIRYYSPETFSRTPGPTRSACNVVEWNPNTARVRGWYECHDHLGNVNRVHPKNINGQTVLSPHYPPIGAELKR